MGNLFVSNLSSQSQEIDPLDARFVSPREDNEKTSGGSCWSIHEDDGKIYLKDENQDVKVQVTTPSLLGPLVWKVMDDKGEPIAVLKRQSLSFKSVIIPEDGGPTITLRKPALLGDFEILRGSEVLCKVKHHLSSYDLEFYDVDENVVAQSVGSYCGSLTYVRGGAGVDLLLCCLVSIATKSIRNGR